MTKTIFAVLDAASGAFGNPWVVPHIGVALRAFTDEVNNPDTGDLFRHPQDFALYEIGSYDDISGTITALPIPKLIAQAASLKNVPQPKE